jgi:general L-amino acid transport system permease protein
MLLQMRSAAPVNSVPFYRDTRVLALAAQLLFLVLVLGLVVWLFANLRRGLQAQNLSTSFDFLASRAGFEVAEGSVFGLPYSSDSSYLEAFGLGLYNTVRVAAVGIVLASLLGLLAGVARLSTNWLVNRLALAYVEAIRNTPLLVQLVFWYFAVILQMPPVRQSVKLGPDVYLSQQGLALPWPVPGPAFAAFWPWLVAAILVAAFVWEVLARRRAQSGLRNRAGWWALLALAGLTGLGYLVSGDALDLSRPVMGAFRLTGGASLSPEFTALLVALVVYTGAFIAEIVRAGIQAVHKGQWEAARSLGLAYGETLQLVVLPQALRVIIPPLGNQYLNLTKNSSLAVAVGYPDLFNVANTAGNQSGNNVQAMAIILGLYLALSILVASGVNLLNRGTRLRSR